MRQCCLIVRARRCWYDHRSEGHPRQQCHHCRGHVLEHQPALGDLCVPHQPPWERSHGSSSMYRSSAEPTSSRPSRAWPYRCPRGEGARNHGLCRTCGYTLHPNAVEAACAYARLQAIPEAGRHRRCNRQNKDPRAGCFEVKAKSGRRQKHSELHESQVPGPVEAAIRFRPIRRDNVVDKSRLSTIAAALIDVAIQANQNGPLYRDGNLQKSLGTQRTRAECAARD